MSAFISFDFEKQAVRGMMRDGGLCPVVSGICRAPEIGTPTEAFNPRSLVGQAMRGIFLPADLLALGDV